MSFPCCCSLSVGVRAAGLVSALLALAVCGLGGVLFMEAYEERQSDAFQAKQALGSTITDGLSFIGVKEKVDFVKVNRIKLACFGVAVGAAGLQLISSLLILLCPETGGKSTAKLYSFINPFVLIALIGVCGCFFAEGSGIDYQEDKAIQGFLAAAIADSALLIYLICVAGAFLRS